MNKPLISVILPVYNGEKHLAEAVTSILSQCFKAFELIIIDDGSTDRSVEIIEEFPDERIRLLRNRENKGLVFSLNLGIAESAGKYIARIDADDIAHPERLKIQFEFMEKKPEIAVCGTFVERFGSIFRSGVLKLPVTNDEIRARMLFGNPFAHPTVMIRKDLLVKHNLLYKDKYQGAEDYALWVEMAEKSLTFANIPTPLLRYRVSDWSVSGEIFFNREKLIKRYTLISEIQKLAVHTLFEHVEFESNIHKLVYMNRFNKDFIKKEQVRNLSLWLKKLMKANKADVLLDNDTLHSTCKEIFFKICITNAYLGLKLLKEMDDFDDYHISKKLAVLIKFFSGAGHMEIFLKKLYFRMK